MSKKDPSWSDIDFGRQAKEEDEIGGIVCGLSDGKDIAAYPKGTIIGHCNFCGDNIFIGPSSIEVRKKHPDVILCCYECALKKMGAAERKISLPPQSAIDEIPAAFQNLKDRLKMEQLAAKLKKALSGE